MNLKQNLHFKFLNTSDTLDFFIVKIVQHYLPLAQIYDKYWHVCNSHTLAHMIFFSPFLLLSLLMDCLLPSLHALVNIFVCHHFLTDMPQIVVFCWHHCLRKSGPLLIFIWLTFPVQNLWVSSIISVLNRLEAGIVNFFWT